MSVILFLYLDTKVDSHTALPFGCLPLEVPSNLKHG
jgi:hypothetical protein